MHKQGAPGYTKLTGRYSETPRAQGQEFLHAWAVPMLRWRGRTATKDSMNIYTHTHTHTLEKRQGMGLAETHLLFRIGVPSLRRFTILQREIRKQTKHAGTTTRSWLRDHQRGQWIALLAAKGITASHSLGIWYCEDIWQTATVPTWHLSAIQTLHTWECYSRNRGRRVGN